ncbi:hypothetical protein Bca52824_034106, partial [Brassica carinata]
YNKQFKIFEPLEFKYNVCEALLLWEQVRAFFLSLTRNNDALKILNGSDNEVLIIKSVTHRDFNEMIKTVPNPVYLFQGIVLRRGAKGTGMKSVELALSMCDIVDIYGFTVDPGSWILESKIV